MLSDNAKLGVRHNASAGLWAHHISTPQFWAWKVWMFKALGYNETIHSNWLTVWDEWPPTTSAGASRVAQAISDLRDELNISKPVPRRPEPWDGKRQGVPEEYRNVEVC